MKGYKQILVQADYTLAGRTVYERTVKEAITEEIEPDTISAFMYDKYCESAVNTSEAFSNCPEDIPSEDGKLAEVTKWTEWLRDHYPHRRFETPGGILERSTLRQPDHSVFGRMISCSARYTDQAADRGAVYV